MSSFPPLGKLVYRLGLIFFYFGLLIRSVATDFRLRADRIFGL